MAFTEMLLGPYEQQLHAQITQRRCCSRGKGRGVGQKQGKGWELRLGKGVKRGGKEKEMKEGEW